VPLYKFIRRNHLVPKTSAETVSAPVANAYFPALTGVRAVAALLVFTYHAVPREVPTTTNFLLKWLLRLGQQGYVGVSVFFVLSGFLITARYANNIELTKEWLYRYLQNRFARIYPLYFLLTTFSFAVTLLHPRHTWYELPASATKLDEIAAVLLNITLTRAFFGTMLFVGIPTAWTLTVEESFYLGAPFLLLLLRHNLSLVYILPVLLLLIGMALVAFCHWLPIPYGFMNSVDIMINNTFFGRSGEFLIGAGLAFWMKKGLRLPSTYPNATTIGTLGILAAMVALSVVEHSFPTESIFRFYTEAGINYTLLPCLVAVFLWGLINERTWLQQLLQSKTFLLLGKSSYAFYLLHLGAVDTLFYIYVTSNWVVRLVIYTLMSIGLYKWVENPLQQRLRATHTD